MLESFVATWTPSTKRWDSGISDWRHQRTSELKQLPDRDFPNRLDELARRIETLATNYGDADLVFVPRHDDYHADHSTVTHEVLKGFRRATLLEYEIKDFRRTTFRSNLLVDVSGDSFDKLIWNDETFAEPGFNPISFAKKKAVILAKILPRILELASDITVDGPPRVYSEELVLGRMAVRSAEFNVSAHYSEGFATDLAIS
jgi:hypothetical protein